MSAELEYMFRHALVCEGSYQLLPPAERASLHRAALDLVPIDPSDPDASAAELARHAGLAQELGHEDPELRDRECELLLRAAKRASEAWDQSGALAYFTRLLDRDTADSTRKVSALTGLAGTYMNIGNRAAARPMIEPAIKAAQDAGAAVQEAKLRRMMAELLLEASELDGALHHAKLAEQAARRTDDESGTLQAGLVVARVLAARRDDTAALELMTRLYAEAPSALTKAQVANVVGVYFARRRADGQARHWLELSVCVAEEAGLAHQHAAALGNLGNVLDYLGDQEGAAAAYTKALRIHQGNGSHWWVAMQYWNLGLLHNNRGDYAQALPLLRLAQSMFQELGQTRHLRQCTTGIAQALLHLGKIPQSLELAQKVLADTPEHHTDEIMLDAIQIVFMWAMLCGDAGKAAQWLDRLRRTEHMVRATAEWELQALRLRMLREAIEPTELVRLVADLRDRVFTRDGRSLDLAPALVHMDETSFGTALLYRGFLLDELSPALQHSLVAWLRKHQPDEVQRLRDAQPAIWAALNEGL